MEMVEVRQQAFLHLHRCGNRAGSRLTPLVPSVVMAPVPRSRLLVGVHPWDRGRGHLVLLLADGLRDSWQRDEMTACLAGPFLPPRRRQLGVTFLRGRGGGRLFRQALTFSWKELW